MDATAHNLSERDDDVTAHNHSPACARTRHQDGTHAHDGRVDHFRHRHRVHAYWIGIAGVVVEFLLIGSMTMLLNPGVDAGSDPCTMLPGGWQLCATPDYSAIALYCGAGLIGALIGYGIGSLLRRHLHKADSV